MSKRTPSRAAELARAEAARAEAEATEPAEPVEPADPTEPGDPPVEPVEPTEPTEPPAPEQTPGEAPAPPEAVALALASSFDAEGFDREAKRHERAIVKLFGEGMAERLCDACDGIGYVPPWKEAAAMPPTHADFRPCVVCEGWGVVQTGSIREGRQVAECPHCGGNGYEIRQVRQAQVAAAGHEANGAEDEWGVEPWMGDTSIRPEPPVQPAAPQVPVFTGR